LAAAESRLARGIMEILFQHARNIILILCRLHANRGGLGMRLYIGGLPG
jgi:hypothetical protein